MARITLDEIVDPFEAKIVVAGDTARLDLSALPRLDPILAGRPAAEVPKLVERLCGLCPAAHHLAGVRALEALLGLGVPPAAERVRRLLHHGSVLSVHATRLALTDKLAAVSLRAFAKQAMAAAGSPGHFPATAVPGGAVELGEDALQASQECAGQAADALETALRVVGAAAQAAAQSAAQSAARGPGIQAAPGLLDVALVTGDHLDLYGQTLRAAHDGKTILEASDDAVIVEASPGDPAPRPYLAGQGPYRVGPVAQLRVAPLSTPLARQWQERWLGQGGQDPAWARTIIMAHCVEVIKDLLSHTDQSDTDQAEDSSSAATAPAAPSQVGTGWVDGARGLLIHRYEAAAWEADRVLERARILTPTAQNEYWLAQLLAQAVASGELGFEAAIRTADPCLPITSAPPGTMKLMVEQLMIEKTEN
ncbi:MAG: nickel-dependent hydrogenase large subunit [Propionibacteriaceae bacterium]|jgi:NAD-reducing hydrogenase large subunit|nr:nickel-dependent hydrogenase large subunit [Propionibacteriaceae bacterium]